MRYAILAVALLTGLGMTCVSVHAGNISMDHISEARASLANQDYVKTINSLKDALEAVWNEMPLGVQNAVFVTTPPEDFGEFSARESNVFSAIEPVQIYCEPMGCVQKKSGRSYSVSINYDFQVMDAQANPIGGLEGIEAVKVQRQVFSPDIMMAMTFNLKGIKAGNYTLRITLHDNNSEKMSSFELPFVIK